MVVYNWEKIKEVSNWVNITFENSDEAIKVEHFGFGFKIQSLYDILRFQFTLLGSNTNKIEFADDKKSININILLSRLSIFYQIEFFS